jgi:hypothetical protein
VRVVEPKEMKLLHHADIAWDGWLAGKTTAIPQGRFTYNVRVAVDIG